MKSFNNKTIFIYSLEGTFNAILGPNGAGKSATISMLIGLKQPTQGEVIL